MRFPKNKLKENQYTSGGEFIDSSTNKIYSGYYWEANGKFFIGKIVTNNPIELRKLNSEEIKNLSIKNKLPFKTPSTVSNKITSAIKLKN